MLPSRPGRTVLVTRAEPHASALAVRLRDAGFTPVVFPLLRPVFWDSALPCPVAQIAACVFTSRVAVRAMAARAECAALVSKPCFAVGSATASDLAALGGRDVRTAPEAGGHSLIPLLSEVRGQVLHVCGEELSEGTVALRTSLGARLVDWTVYAMDQQDAPPPHTDIVLLYSPRAAALYVSHTAPADLSRTVALCLGKSCIDLCTRYPFADVRVAESPTDDAVLHALDALK